jgi:DNA invertase Pin-like site-specific DNA recombinase
MTTTRLAAIYSRVSTEEQADTSGVASTSTQIDQCKSKAATLGIPLVSAESGLIVEEVHSGSDLRWAGTRFMELVRRAQRGEFTDLICLDIDRFSRGGVAAYFEQEQYFQKAGVTIHYVSDDVPADMPFRDMLIAARADAAKWWKDKLREASVRVRAAYAEQGHFIPGGTPPYGWQPIYHETLKNRNDTPVQIGLKPHPTQAAILLQMYEHLAAGGSVLGLAHLLDTQHVPTPRKSVHWQEPTITRILHNPTNWGERISFATHEEPHKDGVDRSARQKSSTTTRQTTPDELYIPTQMVWEPIPGLTRDLAMRALFQLDSNKRNARRHASYPDDVRATRGLLFNGWARCSVCGRGLGLKPAGGGSTNWYYRCYHPHTTHQGEPMISVSAKVLDKLVWDMAVQAIRDPAFFERLIAKTQEVSGAAFRAASLESQLEKTTREREIIFKQLRQLDPDDPDNARSIASYQLDLCQTLATIEELAARHAAALAEVAKEQERASSIKAFHQYAASQRDHLEQKTPLERRQILGQLRTRVRCFYPDNGVRVQVAFDVRYLPRAAELVNPQTTEQPSLWLDFAKDAPVYSWQVQVLKIEGNQAFQEIPTDPAEWQSQGFASEEGYNAYIMAQLREQDKAGE